MGKISQVYRHSGHTVYATVAQSVYILPSMCHESVLSDVHASSQSIHVEEKLRERNNNGAHALSRSLAKRLNENQLCRNNKNNLSWEKGADKFCKAFSNWLRLQDTGPSAQHLAVMALTLPNSFQLSNTSLLDEEPIRAESA